MVEGQDSQWEDHGWVGWVVVYSQASTDDIRIRYKESYFITDYIFTTNSQVSQDFSSNQPIYSSGSRTSVVAAIGNSPLLP